MVWERVRELQRKAEQEAREQEANRIKWEREMALKAQQEKENKMREKEERRRIVKKVLEESGALSTMREIEKGLEGNVRKHAIVEDLDARTAWLAWGNKFKVDNVEITYEKHWGRRGEKDFSYIRVEVATYDESIKIGLREIKKDEWQTNRKVVQDMLAEEYLHPQRVNEWEPPKGYSSSSSSNTECCNQ